MPAAALRLASWYSSAVIWKKEDDHFHIFLVSHTTKRAVPKKQIKFPGGKSTGHPEDKNFLDTLYRELGEELGLSLRTGMVPEAFYSRLKGDHQKVFYLIHAHALRGRVRTEPLEERTSTVSAPFWVKLDLETCEDLYRAIFENHQPVFVEFLKKFKFHGILTRLHSVGLIK